MTPQRLFQVYMGTIPHQLGYEVQETPVSITEAMAADEIFTTGTAVVVSAIGSLTYQVGATLFRTWALHGFARHLACCVCSVLSCSPLLLLWWSLQ